LHGSPSVKHGADRRSAGESRERFLEAMLHARRARITAIATPSGTSQHWRDVFAAKEAVLKVLGTGWRGESPWTDIEILPSIRPAEIRLSGECLKIAKKLEFSKCNVSISHIETMDARRLDEGE